MSLTCTNLFGTETANLQTSIQINPPVTVTPPSPPSPGPGGQPPVANFTGSPRTGEVPLTVRFTDTSEGGANWWRWTLGDGRISTEMSPVHTYTKPGIYTVSLAVRNDFSSDARIEEGYIIVTGDDPTPVTPQTPAPLTPVPSGGSGYHSGGDGSADGIERPISTDKPDDMGITIGSLLRSWWWLLLVLAAFTAAGYYYYTYVWKDKRDGWS